MKKSVLVLLLSFTLCSAFGQSGRDEYQLDATLLKVRNMLEKCLAGTNIRSLKSDFGIRLNKSSNSYVFSSDVNNMLSITKKAALNAKLNKTLDKRKEIKLVGSIYFDDYLDSALVRVTYFNPDTIYDFVSISRPPWPREGYEKFSKDLHDVIKTKIRERRIVKDSLVGVEYIEFNVGRGGMFKRDNRNSLNKELDSFFAAKKSFANGMFSGRLIEIKVALVLFKNYLFNNGPWPERSINNSGYVDQGGQWAHVQLITPFDVCEETFYSNIPPYQSTRLRAVVSMVYDGVLQKYIRPVIHFGEIKETDQLVEDLKSVHRGDTGYIDSRVYFYREK